MAAAERGSRVLLCGALALVGVAFNVKMLAAFVVLPVFFLVYALGAGGTARRRVADLALGLTEGVRELAVDAEKDVAGAEELRGRRIGDRRRHCQHLALGGVVRLVALHPILGQVDFARRRERHLRPLDLA